MNPNEEGIFDAISEDGGVPVEPETQTPAEEPKSVPEPETKTVEPVVTEPIAEGAEAPEVEPSKSDSQESEKTETKTEKAVDWKSLLPPAPGEYQGKSPILDENGVVTNMNAQEYEDYIISKAEHRLSQRSHAQRVEGAALDEVEKILPEIKDNPTIRKAIEDRRIADVVNGKSETTIVELAQELRTMLGNAKAEGAQNTKVSIETQQVAAVETGNTQTQPSEAKGEDLTRRINEGDPEAFVELLSEWGKQGYV